MEYGDLKMRSQKYRKFAALFCISLIMIIVPSFFISVFAGELNFIGEGTIENPYLIMSTEDLLLLASFVNNANVNFNDKVYRLDADINLSDIKNWTGIEIGRAHV